MQHTLPELPYPKNGLSPHISEETLDYHYGKHHAAYVTKLNAGVKGTEFENMSLKDIIQKSDGAIFNNAAQVWNHTFYWNCLSPNGGGNPTGEIASLIYAKWNNFESFKEAFSNAAANNFGSGWTWLVQKNNNLEIINTDDADTPLKNGDNAVLTIDVWEHAYYIDYRNVRPKYIEAFWNLVNWNFVNQKISN